MRQSPMSVRRRCPLWSRIASELGAVLLAAASAALGFQARAQAPAPGPGRAATAPQAAPQPAPQRAQPAKQPRGSQPPISIDAGFSRVDYNTNTVIFRNIVVSQGDTRLTSERAHAAGVGFANSEWTFEGNVQMVLQPRGTLHCDRAVVTFRDNRITVATATGNPARFEQPPSDSRRAVSGSAEQIVYEAAADSVRLSGNARLSDGRGLEVSGPVLVYDVREERLQAPSSGNGRGVHITVKPRAEPK